MSIANLITQPDAAYLITDAGFFEADGTIFALWPKTFLARDDLFAYACVGNCARLLLYAGHEMGKRLGTTSFGPAGFMELIREAYDALGADPTIHYSRWVAAGWSRERNCPVGLAFFTGDNDARPGDPPWVWREYHSLLQPHITPGELGSLGYAHRDLLEPSRFRPKTGSLALVDLVRRRRDGWGADGSESGCMVAGKITLTKVTQHGVEMSLLHEYPDRVGEVAGNTITPARDALYSGACRERLPVLAAKL